ncbi:MAG: hypoxanthine-guanine phosphoribosyltransferase [Halofilum sp. (in: g-proteobacteria)]|nr:hypoxanthine-guanine phosphoribosyltransferase [Halofilum sp. (in: g-proteobacteria)]
MSAPDVSAAERLHAPAEVEAACARMGAAIGARIGDGDCLALCLLQGGIVPTGLLLPRIDAALELDSIHVTRYRNTTRGGDVQWHTLPRAPVAGRRVLLIDDILDEGHSLAAVQRWLLGAGAREVLTAVLVDKRHERKHPEVAADFVGLEVPDRYVFGYGMDYHGWHRNAPGIFALAD